MATGSSTGCPSCPRCCAIAGRDSRSTRGRTRPVTTRHPIRFTRAGLEETVHLETRCDGEAHDGCQAGCLLYWKQAWLKPVSPNPKEIDGLSGDTPSVTSVEAPSTAGCDESEIWTRTQVSNLSEEAPTYCCQATQVHHATSPLAWWDPRQYFEDYWSGNVGLGRMVSGLIYSMYYNLSQAGLGVGPAMRWFYDRFHAVWGGTLFPRKPGIIPEGEPTPTATLDLQPGETVRVKSHKEILKTVDTGNRNRGMYWDAELVPYCGETHRVLKRVTRIIDERTGKMQEMKTPCIILDSVVCQARYSPCRMLCPKSMYPYWREIWLERIKEAEASLGDGFSGADERVTTISTD